MRNCWKTFIECDCSTEGVMVSVSDEDTIDLAFCAITGKYSNTKMSWKDRFRWCVEIIMNGNPYLDMVILNKESARKLMNELKLFLAQGVVRNEQENTGEDAENP